MATEYLENAKKLFRSPDWHLIYEGKGCPGFDLLLELLGYIIPNKVNAEELVVFLSFLTNDIRNKNCGFHNSENFKDLLEKYIEKENNLDQWLTYLPNYIKRISSQGFYSEFIQFFKSTFYGLTAVDKEETYGCIEIEQDMIDIRNKNKADVLAALYNHAKPVGMGIVQYDPTPMDKKTAQYVLDHMGYHFGYLMGRPIKMSLEDDIIYVGNYNRDNDEDGLAQRAIATCPNIEKNKKDGSYQKAKREKNTED